MHDNIERKYNDLRLVNEMDKAMAAGKSFDEFLLELPNEVKPEYIVKSSKLYTYWEQLWDENNPDHLDQPFSQEELGHIAKTQELVDRMRENGSLSKEQFVEATYPSLTESEVRGFLKMDGPERKQLISLENVDLAARQSIERNTTTSDPKWNAMVNRIKKYRAITKASGFAGSLATAVLMDQLLHKAGSKNEALNATVEGASAGLVQDLLTAIGKRPSLLEAGTSISSAGLGALAQYGSTTGFEAILKDAGLSDKQMDEFGRPIAEVSGAAVGGGSTVAMSLATMRAIKAGKAAYSTARAAQMLAQVSDEAATGVELADTAALAANEAEAAAAALDATTSAVATAVADAGDAVEVGLDASLAAEEGVAAADFWNPVGWGALTAAGITGTIIGGEKLFKSMFGGPKTPEEQREILRESIQSMSTGKHKDEVSEIAARNRLTAYGLGMTQTEYEQQIWDAHTRYYQYQEDMRRRAQQLGVPVDDYHQMIQNVQFFNMPPEEALQNMFGKETQDAWAAGYDSREDYLSVLHDQHAEGDVRARETRWAKAEIDITKEALSNGFADMDSYLSAIDPTYKDTAEESQYRRAFDRGMSLNQYHTYIAAMADGLAANEARQTALKTSQDDLEENQKEYVERYNQFDIASQLPQVNEDYKPLSDEDVLPDLTQNELIEMERYTVDDEQYAKTQPAGYSQPGVTSHITTVKEMKEQAIQEMDENKNKEP